jgi:hypothetical protein
MLKLRIAASAVPTFVTVAEDPGSPVVTVPMVIVPAVPEPPPLLRLPLMSSSEWRASPDSGSGLSFQPLVVRGP